MSEELRHLGGGRVQRERGEDVVIEVRVRASQYKLLLGDGLHLPRGVMQLVAEPDGTHAICIWADEIPKWPEPVPGNRAAAAELARAASPSPGEQLT